MSNDTKQLSCSECGGIFRAEELNRLEDMLLCPQCYLAVTERLARERGEKRPTPAKKRKSRKKEGVLLAAAVLLMLFSAYQWSSALPQLDRPSPIRRGYAHYDRGTDACIANLWKAARMLQEGKLPGGELVCPVSGKPYKVEKKGAVVRVFCPNPERHGASCLYVDNRTFCPRAEGEK